MAASDLSSVTPDVASWYIKDRGLESELTSSLTGRTLCSNKEGSTLVSSYAVLLDGSH